MEEIIKEQEKQKENGTSSDSKYFEVIRTCPKCGDTKWYITEKFGQMKSRECKCEKVERFKKLSIFDKNSENNTFENAKFENDKEEKYSLNFKTFVEKFGEIKEKGLGILMFGNAGTGKTFYSACIANKLMQLNCAVLSFNLSGYLAEIRKDFDMAEEKLLEAVRNADLIVIDDLGSELVSESFGKEKLFNLIDTIYREKKCVIITSNFSSKQLSEHLRFNGSDKILDRLSEKCKSFLFDWESRRKKINAELWEGIF